MKREARINGPKGIALPFLDTTENTANGAARQLAKKTWKKPFIKYHHVNKSVKTIGVTTFKIMFCDRCYCRYGFKCFSVAS